MRQRRFLIAATAALAMPAMAHPGHGQARSSAAEMQSPGAADRAMVQAVLSEYKAAIEGLDVAGTERLFAGESAIFESGGSEGTYANYLSHHLRPELSEFKSFAFSDYKVDVHLLAPAAAHAIETYKYRIETKTGQIVDRLGVATSVLHKENGQWKIVLMHNSSWSPRA